MCDELLRLGYNPSTLQPLLPIDDLSAALRGVTSTGNKNGGGGLVWTRALDEQLLAHASSTSEAAGTTPLSLSPLELSAAHANDHPKLALVPLANVRARFMLLRRMNLSVLSLLPWLDLSVSSRVHSLAHEICSARGLLFYDTKV